MQCRILTGDCRDVLKTLPAESVHCVVTSPPYWGLRSYGGDEGMIGLEPTFEEHLVNLAAVFREVWARAEIRWHALAQLRGCVRFHNEGEWRVIG